MPPMDRNQFITQMLFQYAGMVMPQLVQRREFSSIEELNEEVMKGVVDLYERYKQVTGDTVNISVGGNPLSVPPNYRAPGR
jgi:hypothetical protein